MTGWPLRDTTLRERTAVAVADPVRKANVRAAVDRFGTSRQAALAEIADPDGLRRAARGVRAGILADWDGVLDRLVMRFEANGGTVFRAPDPAAANGYISDLAERTGCRRIVKSKSMVTEELGLNEHLEARGAEVTETDLGEWIIQLAGEHPSHIIIPAVHRNRHQIADTFQQEAGLVDRVTSPEELTAFARGALRERFLAADMGITGVNFAVAETGSLVLVTNEGNGRMSTTLPRVHVAVMGAERVVETWEQLDLLLTLLVRSATGQRLSSYTTVTSGPRQPGEADGPDELHLVIVDNGRRAIADTEFAEMLNCIRCGACLNVCPVYRQTGGHAYGWVYPGPMGAVLTPLLALDSASGGAGHDARAEELAGASTLCGACMQACPVEIPLQDLLLALRRRRVGAGGGPRRESAMWKAWAAAWSRPAAYRRSGSFALRAGRLAPVAERLGLVGRLVGGRSLPELPRRTFTERWRAGDV